MTNVFYAPVTTRALHGSLPARRSEVSAGDTRRAGCYCGLPGMTLPGYASRTLMPDRLVRSFPRAWTYFTGQKDSPGRTVYKSVSSKNCHHRTRPALRSQGAGWSISQERGGETALCLPCGRARRPRDHAPFKA
mgnify:FL=1